MKEVIKGQDKLRIAVEKLEAEIFKDWPVGKITRGLLVSDCYVNMTIESCVIGAHSVNKDLRK